MPEDYPKSPPKATFRTRIWHPNVEEKSGAVCVDTLKRDWRAELTLKDVLVVSTISAYLLAICVLLSGRVLIFSVLGSVDNILSTHLSKPRLRFELSSWCFASRRLRGLCPTSQAHDIHPRACPRRYVECSDGSEAERRRCRGNGHPRTTTRGFPFASIPERN